MVTYFGIDLSDNFCQISYYNEKMEEPESISMHIGSSSYLIPTVVGKKEGIGQWFVGDDALKQNIVINNLLQKAIKHETIKVEDKEIEAVNILALFFRRIIALTSTVAKSVSDVYYVFCVDYASSLMIETITEAMSLLNIDSSRIKICSRKECFCYYIMNQEASLSLHEVLLIDYWKDTVKLFSLSKDKKVTPVIVSVNEVDVSKERDFANFDGLTADEIKQEKDRRFNGLLDDILPGRIISSVFLVGEGFEGDWMKQSQSRLCAGRRVFSGMNLYTKGACFYGKVIQKNELEVPDYIYLGGGNMINNICLKVFHKDEYIYKVLVPAGFNWQDAKGEMDLILDSDEEPSLDIYVKPLMGDEPRMESFKLEGLNVSKDLTTRIRVIGEATSRDRIIINVIELGFGDIKPGRNRKWQFELLL